MFEAAVKALRQRADAPPALLSRLLSGWAWMIERRYSYAGHERALQTAGEALPLAQQAADRRAEAWAIYMQAYVLWRLERMKEAEALAERARAIFKELNLRWETALAQHLLSMSVWMGGDPVQGVASMKAALELRRALGDQWGMGHTLNVLAILHQSNLDDYQAALSYYQHSLEAFRQIGDRQGMWFPTNNSGEVLAWMGQYEAARQKFAEARALADEVGNRNLAGATRLSLMWATLWEGNLDQAEAQAQADLAILLQMDMEDPLAEVRSALSEIAAERGDWPTARQFLIGADMRGADLSSGAGRLADRPPVRRTGARLSPAGRRDWPMAAALAAGESGPRQRRP